MLKFMQPLWRSALLTGGFSIVVRVEPESGGGTLSGEFYRTLPGSAGEGSRALKGGIEIWSARAGCKAQWSQKVAGFALPAL
jgi:hypothetical protein